MYGNYSEAEWNSSSPYTDLALERRRADVSIDGVDYKKEIGIFGVWERIRISSDRGAESIGKPKGVYDTFIVSRMDLLDEESIDDSRDEIARELCYLCDLEEIIPEKLLVVGLGNSDLTPDSVGTKCAREVKPTMHIKKYDQAFFNALECSEIAVCTPGVAAKSGLDSIITVRGICNEIKPDAVIVIDALTARSDERLGTTVQFSTTGILPGSGVGNLRGELSKKTLDVPVIAIGVPTVIDSRSFSPYEESRRPLVKRQPMLVSPKEIGEITDVCAKIIGGGINQAFGVML